MKKLKIQYLLLILAIMIGSLVLYYLDEAKDKNAKIKPLKKGSITVAYDQEPVTLNPFSPEGTVPATKIITSNILWGLLVVTPDLKYAPRIAEEVPTIENGLVKENPFTVTFNIKEDAKWSDGTPITAEDVKFTWEMIMSGAFPMADRSGYDKIERIDTPYVKTARITFKEPYAAYKNLFSTVYPLLPKHLLEGKNIEEYMRNFLTFSSGPYKFREWQHGDHLTIVRNESYWDESPKIGKVTFRFIPKTSVQLSRFIDGKNDVIFPSTSDTITSGLKLPVVKRLEFTPSPVWEHIGFNLNKAPLNDINVRKAIAHAINREEVAKKATGRAQALNSILVPEQAVFYTPAWGKYDYNPQKASRYLEIAGYHKGSNGFYEKGDVPLTVALSTTTGDYSREKAQKVIKNNLQTAGIKVEIKNADPKTFLNSWLPDGNFEIATWAWVANVEPELEHIFSMGKMPPSGENYYRYAGSDVTGLLSSANITIGIADRSQIYRKVQEKISDDVVVIPLYQHLQILGYDKRIHGVENNTSYEGPLWNLGKWRILKEQPKPKV